MSPSSFANTSAAKTSTWIAADMPLNFALILNGMLYKSSTRINSLATSSFLLFTVSSSIWSTDDERKAAELGFWEGDFVRVERKKRTNVSESGSLGGGRKEPLQEGDMFTIFVDFISNRVSKKWLRDIFEQYGVVEEVYIVYKNQKRANFASTFGFVRYKNMNGVRRALREADYLMVDGFKIRVFESRKSPTKNFSELKNDNGKGVVTALDSDSRRVKSYKQVVSDPSTEKMPSKIIKEERPKVPGKEVPLESNVCYNIAVPKQGGNWTDACIIGVIKGEVRGEVVQMNLELMGIKCKVSQWSVLSVILIFSSMEDRDDAIINKADLLSVWLTRFKKYEYGVSMPEICVWVHLINVPLPLWHEEFFRDMGNRWGS